MNRFNCYISLPCCGQGMDCSRRVLLVVYTYTASWEGTPELNSSDF